MPQTETPTKRLRVRSIYDPRWLFAFGFGLVLSLVYYGLLIWGGVWLLRAGLAFFATK